MPRLLSISSASALWVIECVRRRGKPVAELFELAGIDPKAPPTADQHLAAARYLALWDRATALVEDPGFALRTGAAFDLGSLGIFGFLAMHCDTLGEAHHRTAAVRALYNVGARWELVTRGARVRLVWHAWPLRAGSPSGLRSMNEYQVAEMLTAMRTMAKQALVPSKVAFLHRAEGDLGAHREVLGVEPAFGADWCGLEADAAWLKLPIRTGNARLRDYFERQCAQVQAAFARDPPFAARVRELLSAAMNGQVSSLEAIARTLAMTGRTLQRRLAAEGTSFNQVADEVRREFAERYLARPELALAEIAWLIGFTEPSAFHKAFRRWTGKTPGAWRASR